MFVVIQSLALATGVTLRGKGTEPSTERGAALGIRTDAERKAIHEQLDRLLASPLFRHSKRYPNLLRYVVERALDGHAGELKERTAAPLAVRVAAVPRQHRYACG